METEERESRQIGEMTKEKFQVTFFAHSSNFADLYPAASGFGGGYCEEGVPTEAALLAVLAAFAVSFGILYMASTTNMAGRKKRSGKDEPTWTEKVQDVLWKGDFSRLKSQS